MADWIMGTRGNLWYLQNYGASAATEVMVPRQISLTLNKLQCLGSVKTSFLLFQLYNVFISSLGAHEQ